MYKKLSELSQRRARQLWLANLQGKEFEQQPPDIQRANLVRALKNMRERAALLPKHSIERKELGYAQHELSWRIHELRPKLKGGKDVPSHFVDVCRERMHKVQFDIIMREASQRANA